MKKRLFSIHDFFSFSLVGKGSLFEYLCYQYDFFSLKKSDGERFKIEIVEKVKFDKRKRLVDVNDEYYRDEDTFIFKLNGSSFRFNGTKRLKDQKSIKIEESFSKMKANTIIDLFFRMINIENEIQLVHAACVESKGKGVLIPAWKGMGKTNACLEFVKNGYRFLGDDKVWLKSDGSAFAYPRYVVIKGNDNFEFKNKLKGSQLFKLTFRKFLTKIFNTKKRPIAILVNLMVKPIVYYFRISELIDGAEIRETTVINEVFYLSKNKRNKSFEKLRTSNIQISRYLVSIANAEWNLELLKIAAAHDVLFSDNVSWTKELNSLFALEEKNIEKALMHISCSEVVVPANEDQINWSNFYTETCN